MAYDERVYGPWGRLAWGHGLPCVVVGCETRDRRPYRANMIECAHVGPAGTKGIGYKSSYVWTVFMCWRHHDLLDQSLGRRLFAKRFKLAVNGVPVDDLTEAAAETERQWREREDGLAF